MASIVPMISYLPMFGYHLTIMLNLKDCLTLKIHFFQEAIAEQSYNYERTLGEKCNLFWLRLLTNFTVLVLMAGAAYLINFSASLSLSSV